MRNFVLLLTATWACAGTAWAADTAAGKTLYERNCLACHGVGGAGDGPAARALRPPPTSFTDKKTWEGLTDERLSASIRTGRPGSSMMAFGSLSPEELANLVAYLRTFAPAE